MHAMHRVGEGGFEPPASCSQSRRATKLRHSPVRSLTLSAIYLSERHALLRVQVGAQCDQLVRDGGGQGRLTLVR